MNANKVNPDERHRIKPTLGRPHATHPNLGAVIAWGHVGAYYDGEEYDRWCILSLLPESARIANERNYVVWYYYPNRIPGNLLGRVEATAFFPNIVPAVRCYEDWGMDY